MIVTVGSVFILRSAVRLRHLYRNQALALVLGIPLPWIGNILYVFNLGIPGLDLTEFGFGITGFVLAWALYRLQLFNIVPVARDKVIEWMHECLVVVDSQQHILDANPAMVHLLAEISPDEVAQTSAKVIGSTVEKVFIHFPKLAELFKAGSAGQFELQTGEGARRLDFDARISALHNQAQDIIGWMAILHDITDLNQARETAFDARDQAVEAAAENSRLYEQMKQLASTDTLTGINTRRNFFDLATAAFKKIGQPWTAYLSRLWWTWIISKGLTTILAISPATRCSRSWRVPATRPSVRSISWDVTVEKNLWFCCLKPA